MPIMAPGITFYARLQPFFIALGDIIIILVLLLAVIVTIATFAYILRREQGWWRQEDELERSKAPVEEAEPRDAAQSQERIVEDIALQYLDYDRLVLTNPGNARLVPVGRLYPDLVIKERVPPPEARREPRILLIGEIETASTFTAEHVARWRTLSRLGAPLALFVPEDALAQAKRAFAQESLAVAQVWAYTYVNGRIELRPGKAHAGIGMPSPPTPVGAAVR